MATSPIREVIQRLRSIHLREGADLTDGQLLEWFLSRHEPAALESLVHRHALMVWGVCRRLLNQHDAEDAFQATFLVFVRKAATIFPRSKVGNWLYGVAHQTAVKARATRAKRMARERQVVDMPEPAVSPKEHCDDLLPLLDQEVSRLPEKYRTAIILCELGGKTARDAAHHLGCAEGTVASRLTRGRALLRKRLARRGLAVAGNGFAGALANTAFASVPTALLTSTLKVITMAAAGQTAATGITSAAVAALTQQVIKAMLLSKLMKTAVVLLALATLTGTAGLVYHTQASESPEASTKSPAAKAEAPNNRQQPTDDLARLQGTWHLVRSESDGLTFSEGRPEVKDSRLVIEKSSVTMTGKAFHDPRVKQEPEDLKMVGTLTLDPKQNPRRIVITWEPNPFLDKNLTQRGIYALDGDTLQLCFHFAGKDPEPTEFSADAGSKRNLGTWKRVTPPAEAGGNKHEAEGNKHTSIDLGNIWPPGGSPLVPGRVGVEITADMVRKMTVRLQSAPAGELDKWVAELERLMDQKLEGELTKQGCRTYFVTRMSEAFNHLQWNANAADNLFKRLQSMPASEAKAWQQTFEAVLQKKIGQTDKTTCDGGPAYAVPLVLIPMDAFHEGQTYSAERGKKYRARLRQLTAEDVSLWHDKVDQFGGTKLDAAVNIILLDNYFDKEKFQRDSFKASVASWRAVNKVDEKEKLQGAWQLVSLQMDGLTVGEGRPELKDAHLIIKQKTLTLHAPETLLHGSEAKEAVAYFKLDLSQTPEVMVLAWKKCPWNDRKNFVSKAIFAMEGDQLKLCLSLKKEEAPRDFSASVGSEQLLWIFKRIPPGRDPQAGRVSDKQGESRPKPPPGQAADTVYLIQFHQLKDEMENLEKSLMQKYQAAKSEAEREAAVVQATRLMKKMGAPLIEKALELVRAHAADSGAVEILAWLLNQQPASPAAAAAADMLARHHLRDPRTLDTASRFQHAPLSWTEPLLRKLADAGLPREQRVRALVYLAVCAKTRAEMPEMFKDLQPAMRSVVEDRFGKQYLAELLAADPAKFEAEAIGRFEELARKYGGEKYGERTVKDYAEASLFEIRRLAVGKHAPDIEGEDIDGSKFKLSDYRGKVVLLDFWGNW
jgi:RNA polymerase sigma factor (sigma-70 family)